jgi:uncharacterized protein YcbK (DUF882 family)
LIRDAAQGARTFFNTFAVIGIAGAVAACSTTSSPLVVDVLTLTDQASSGENAAQGSAAGAGDAVQQDNAVAESHENSSDSAVKLLAYTGAEGSSPDKPGRSDAAAGPSPDASGQLVQSGTASGADEKHDRLAGAGDDVTAGAQAPQKENAGFFASLFRRKPESGTLAVAYASSRDGISQAQEPASLKQPRAESKPVVTHDPSSEAMAELPGVRPQKLFEIGHKASVDDIDTIDANEEDFPVRLASAAGMARMSAQGFITRDDNVDVSCLKPSLVRVLKSVERHYGEHVVITSGYRSPAHNRRVHGARNSLHMYCAATDIKVPGISKWELAKFLRAMPGRGGVGTYCHTNAVHVDVGPERDWNWRCRRRRS